MAQMPRTKNIAIFGANGAIGHALAQALENRPENRVFTLSRQAQSASKTPSHHFTLTNTDEATLENAAAWLREHGPLDWVIVASGFLHDEVTRPEKSLSDISADSLEKYFRANSILPMLIAKHVLPCLHKNKAAVFAALSARVGSIQDNHLGGWYGYRASKAALNMLLKTASIELKRKNPTAAIVGVHPGTVDSALSKPFQRNVPSTQLFSPQQSAAAIIDVLNSMDAKKSGKVWAWDGREIRP